MRPRLLAVGAAVLVTALAGCQSPGYSSLAPKAGPSASTSLDATASLAHSRSYLGVYEKGSPLTYAPVAHFARVVGIQPQLTLYFSGWGEAFRTSFARQAAKHHTSVLVQINPAGVKLSEIAHGRDDDYLKAFASQVRAFRHPVVIGFAHEMNGWWYPWGWTHTSPRVWVAAWRHVVTVFRDQGANNVTWLWTINRGVGGRMAPLKVYWPGAKYVSWVGIDSYYFTRKQDFANTFQPTIDAVRRITKKPIMLGETAIGQIAGQARMLPDLFSGIKRDHLIGLVWYDVAQHGGSYHQNWRLEGHAAALAVFRRDAKAMLRR